MPTVPEAHGSWDVLHVSVVCVSHIEDIGGLLGSQCKKVCSWRALEEEGQRTCVTLAGDLLGNAPGEAMLAFTQGGRVGGCQMERAKGGGSPRNKNIRWRIMEVRWKHVTNIVFLGALVSSPEIPTPVKTHTFFHKNWLTLLTEECKTLSSLWL